MTNPRACPLWIYLCLTIAALAALAIACGGSNTAAPLPTPKEAASGETQPTEPDAPAPTEPPPPTPTPEPPAYKEPVVLAEFSGTGGTVTDNFTAPECQKAVFEWSVNRSSYGTASLILHLQKVGTDAYESIVNEAEFDNPGDTLTGSAVQPLSAGEYYLASENTDEAWTVRVACRDGEKPVGTGIDLAGTGNLVTDNYTLPACQKSVFAWTAAPDSSGSAALIVHFCGRDCESIVNEFKTDVAAPISGEALQAVDGGDFYLVLMNTGGRDWTVKWECRD